MTPQQIAQYCKQRASGPLSQIDGKRKSEDAPNVVLDIKKRESISQRWTATKNWKDMIKEFNQYKALIQNYSPETNAVAQALEKVIKNPSVENVQLLQRCIAMDASDNKRGQDGILGPITTKNLLQVINICRNPPKRDTAPK